MAQEWAITKQIWLKKILWVLVAAIVPTQNTYVCILEV